MGSDIRSRPRYLIVVRVILVHGNKFLLIQREENDKYGPNKWELPGGKLDKGQDLGKAAERELIEEVGVYGYPLKNLVYVDSHIEQSEKFKGIPYIRMACLYKSQTKRIRLSKEHQSYKWVTFSEGLKMDLNDFSRRAILAWEEEFFKETGE